MKIFACWVTVALGGGVIGLLLVRGIHAFAVCDTAGKRCSYRTHSTGEVRGALKWGWELKTSPSSSDSEKEDDIPMDTYEYKLWHCRADHDRWKEEVWKTHQRFYNSLSGHDIDYLRNIWVEDDAVQAYRPFLWERGHKAVVKLCQSIGHTAKSKSVSLFPDDTKVVVMGGTAMVFGKEVMVADPKSSGIMGIMGAMGGGGGGPVPVRQPNYVTNLYRRVGHEWRLWLHHSSRIVDSESLGPQGQSVIEAADGQPIVASGVEGMSLADVLSTVSALAQQQGGMARIIVNGEGGLEGILAQLGEQGHDKSGAPSPPKLGGFLLGGKVWGGNSGEGNPPPLEELKQVTKKDIEEFHTAVQQDSGGASGGVGGSSFAGIMGDTEDSSSLSRQAVLAVRQAHAAAYVTSAQKQVLLTYIISCAHENKSLSSVDYAYDSILAPLQEDGIPEDTPLYQRALRDFGEQISWFADNMDVVVCEDGINDGNSGEN
eukprot:58400_1